MVTVKRCKLHTMHEGDFGCFKHIWLIFGLMNAKNAAIFRFPMKIFKNGYDNV